MCVHCTDPHMHAHTERTLKVHTLLPDTENNASVVQKGEKRQLRDLGYGNAKLLVYDRLLGGEFSTAPLEVCLPSFCTRSGLCAQH